MIAARLRLSPLGQNVVALPPCSFELAEHHKATFEDKAKQLCLCP
jgi:hypothetical protein